MDLRTAQSIASARSFLFVPGDRPDRFAKALDSSADFVILDLEDSVTPGNKEQARQSVMALDAAGCAARILVRVNAAGTADFERDLATCARSAIGGVVLSKVERGADVERASGGAGGLPIIALIESALGLVNLSQIAEHRMTQRLAFGSIDYRLDLAIAEDGQGLAAARSALVLHSRLADLPPPIEGVTANFRSEAILIDDIRVARQFGFSAKLAIHPAQLALINTGFRPTETEIAWARGIVGAVDQQSQQAGSISHAGEMIDRPVLVRASRILESAGISVR